MKGEEGPKGIGEKVSVCSIDDCYFIKKTLAGAVCKAH